MPRRCPRPCESHRLRSRSRTTIGGVAWLGRRSVAFSRRWILCHQHFHLPRRTAGPPDCHSNVVLGPPRPPHHHRCYLLGWIAVAWSRGSGGCGDQLPLSRCSFSGWRTQWPPTPRRRPKRRRIPSWLLVSGTRTGTEMMTRIEGPVGLGRRERARPSSSQSSGLKFFLLVAATTTNYYRLPLPRPPRPPQYSTTTRSDKLSTPPRAAAAGKNLCFLHCWCYPDRPWSRFPPLAFVRVAGALSLKHSCLLESALLSYTLLGCP